VSGAPSSEGLPGRTLDPGFVRWLALFVLAGAAIYLAGVFWSGWTEVARAFARLGPCPLLAAAVVASSAYLVRFCRWHLILRWMGSEVPVRANLGIYMSGLALTASPGKVGELMRTVLLSPFGVPARRSLAAFLADRLSDVLGVCALGVIAAAMNGQRLSYLAAVLAMLTVGSFVFRQLVLHASLWARIAIFLARCGKRWGRLAGDAAFEWARIWSLPRVMLFTALAGAAYGIQALVFAGLCRALGMELPLFQAIEIFVSATLLGAASGLPGGLGAMEAALVVQLMGQGASSVVAITAAIAARLVTLWFGVLIGLGSLLTIATRLEALAARRQGGSCPGTSTQNE